MADDNSTPKFQIGDTVRLKNYPHGISGMYFSDIETLQKFHNRVGTITKIGDIFAFVTLMSGEEITINLALIEKLDV
jgi:hypothetical protein